MTPFFLSVFYFSEMSSDYREAICNIFLNDSKTLVIIRLGFMEVKEHMVLYIYIYIYIYNTYMYLYIYIFIYTVSAQSSTL